jgi:hypothetical protein
VEEQVVLIDDANHQIVHPTPDTTFVDRSRIENDNHEITAIGQDIGADDQGGI